jgi:hypothetical protein
LINYSDLFETHMPSVLDILLMNLQTAEANNSKNLRKNSMYALVSVMKELKDAPLVQKHLSVVKTFFNKAWVYVKFILSTPRDMVDD